MFGSSADKYTSSAQWWVLLYRNRYVPWQTIGSTLGQGSTTFDAMIGYRYSRGRNQVQVHQSLIAKAIFHRGYSRQESLMVGHDLTLLPYTNENNVEEIIDNGESDNNIEQYQDPPRDDWYWGNPNEPSASGRGTA